MAPKLMASLVIGVLFLALSPIVVSSQEIFDAACGRAIIDGRVDPSEWSSASSKTFLMTQGILEATLRVMNSKNYLYMGITINDDEFSTYAQWLSKGDCFRIDFDNDNSGSLYSLGEDVITLCAGLPQFSDSHIYNIQYGSSQADTSAGGTSDGAGVSSRLGNLNHFELRHPLCSGDSLDFCLSPGSSVGFRLTYNDAQADGSFGGGYLYPESSNTSLAHIEIAPCTIDDFFLYLPLVNK